MQKALGIEAGIDQFVASARINRHELGKHKPDLLTVRKLAEVLKVPMAFFYSDTDDEVAELLLRYGRAGEEVRERARGMLGD
jgi:transcriptional regulator with XRE-family HTH domain